MTMLSRVAERLYWMARYLERSEDTARLTNAYTHLIMDMPDSAGLDWDLLIKIFDADVLFESRPRVMSEQNVLRFLLADSKNPSSIVSSVHSARENVRTTRDALPYEVWEYMNELYLFANESAEKSVGRRNRYNYLEQVMFRCQQINGLLMTTLSRDHAYRFIKLGCLLERADMTTRVVDVGVEMMLSRDEQHHDYHTIAAPQIWTSLLRALSCISSYREYTGPMVDTTSAVNFVFKESSHPRSVIFCLRGILEEISVLDNNVIAIGVVERAIQTLMEYSVREKKLHELHKLIDELQLQICEINDLITESWFTRYSSMSAVN